MSISAAQLARSTTPCFILLCRHDPIIDCEALLTRLQTITSGELMTRQAVKLKVLERGGHISFPRRAALSPGSSPRPLTAQLSAWVEAELSSPQ